MRLNVRLWRKLPDRYRQKLIAAAVRQNGHEKSLHALGVRVSN